MEKILAEWKRFWKKNGKEVKKEKSIQEMKLCLNMIVKNESRIIDRLLNSVASEIDCYCICDTGSTDDTISLITAFFQQKKIPGKILQEPFRDFGYNRTFALHACLEMDADYILLLDADMILECRPGWKELTQDAYYIFQGSEQFYYKNTRIVRNQPGFSYWGVTHEYVKTPPHAGMAQLEKNAVFIRDVGDGGCKTDKFIRDVRLLRAGLEQEPNNDRYTFYLANSLRDSNQTDEAIAMYRKRVAIGGWVEEVWYSHFQIGKCYLDMGRPEEAVAAWLDAYNCFPNRIENLYEIVQHYRKTSKYILAQLFYDLARDSQVKYQDDYLFMQKDVYDYKLDYELSIFGYYHNPHKVDLAALSMKILSGNVDEAKNILSNYKFYSKRVGTECTLFADVFQEIQAKLPDGFKSSTPSFCDHPNPNRLYLNVRFVNYSINEQGGYDNSEFIETVNVFAELEKRPQWTVLKSHVLEYDTSFDNKYVGLEDVRLFYHGKILYNANRGLGDRMVVEHGTIERHRTENVKHLTTARQRNIEKNWVLFAVGEELRVVYHWYPLQMGRVKDKVKITQTIPTPALFQHVRGSTNGILVKNELWFLCHVVSYEDRRYYYHLFVVLDKDATRLVNYTTLFTFEGEKVEYALGLKYVEDEFLVGYSVMDRETKMRTIPRVGLQWVS